MTDTTGFTINKFSVVNAPANQSGTRVLASYELMIHGLKISGCILTEGPAGIVSARGIRGKTNKGDQISAQFSDPALERAITRRVAEVYTALTGKEVSDE